MRVLMVQPDVVWEDRPANFAAVDRLVDAAAPESGTLVVLPEMFATGFSMAPESAEPSDGPTGPFLAALARRHGVGVVAGLARRDPGGVARNEAVAIAPDGAQIASYAKRKPFLPGGEVWQAGDTPGVFPWQGVGVALNVCYDLRFPELFRDAARRARPEVFVVIASWPRARIHHWLRLLQARAIENQAYVVGVNRTGSDPFHDHVGRSVVCDPDGEIVGDAGEGAAVVPVTLDIAALRAMRERLRFLEDMDR